MIMICFRNLLGIIFVIGLILSISPITAYSIETQNNNNNNNNNKSGIDLTQTNHMETAPSAKIVNNELENILNKTEMGSQSIEKFDIFDTLDRIACYLLRLFGTIIVMTSMTIPIVFPITEFTLSLTLVLCMTGWILTILNRNEYY